MKAVCVNSLLVILYLEDTQMRFALSHKVRVITDLKMRAITRICLCHHIS